MARLWGEWLTLAIRNLADLFNPKRVVLAGSLSELFQFVEGDVRRLAASDAFRPLRIWKSISHRLAKTVPRLAERPGLRPDL